MKREGKTSEEGEEHDAWGPPRKWRRISSCLPMSVSGGTGWLSGIPMQMRCWPCEDCTLRSVYLYRVSASSPTYIRTPASGCPRSHHWLGRPALKETHEQGRHQIIAPVRRANFHHSCINMKVRLRNQTDTLKISKSQLFASCPWHYVVPFHTLRALVFLTETVEPSELLNPIHPGC